MADVQPNNILRRMARIAGEDRETKVMSPARALRLALARTAAQLWELSLSVKNVRRQNVGLENLADHLPEGALMVLLDGPDGARGGAALDRSLVASLIEVQTIGAVQKSDPTEREPTPTDAAMIAPWLDEALERSDVALKQDEGQGARANDWAVGYRFGALAEDARSLALVLDATDFYVMRLQIEFGEGARVGELLLALPVPSQPEIAEGGAEEGDAPEVGQAFMAVPAELSVVAARLTLTVAEANKLSPGDVLPLEELLLNNAELLGSDGSRVGAAKLGQLDGHWAIKFAGKRDGSAAADLALPELSAPEVASQTGDAGPSALNTYSGLPMVTDGTAMQTPLAQDVPMISQGHDMAQNALVQQEQSLGAPLMDLPPSAGNVNFE